MELNLAKYNRHWEKGFSCPYPKQRRLFGKLAKLIDSREIVQVVGLRRVGKTILLLQLIDFLAKKFNPFSLLYFTFDEAKPTLDELFQEYEIATGKNRRQDKIYIFLDEVQKLPNFQNQIKVYYDLYPNLKFFLSGSSSLFVRQKSQESLAGRIRSFFLPPLDFEEYLYFKEKQGLLAKPGAFGTELEKEFSLFLTSQFIEGLKFGESGERKEYFISIIKKIVFEDLPQLFPIANPEILYQLVKIIGQKPGIILDYQSLASDLRLSSKTISLYLYYLEEAFLVKKLYNFSRNLLSSEKRLKKYFLASPSFSFALTDFTDPGLLTENFLVSLSEVKFFFRDVYQNEVDFVFLQNEKIIPVEVKYKKEVTEQELRALTNFLKKFKVPGGIVLWKNWQTKILRRDKRKITFLPLFTFSAPL